VTLTLDQAVFLAVLISVLIIVAHVLVDR